MNHNMDTQTQIDRLIELAIIQRSELKQLVEQLPQLREHLNAEVEKVFEETEPQLRAELEDWTTKQTSDKTAALGAALEAKITDLAKSLEISTQARYNAIIAEREENTRLAAQAEQKIAEHAASLPSAVKDIVTAELARFPRAGEIDQLRKEFAEPKSLNPRGKWQAGETYNKLDLVTINGDSYTSAIDGNKTRPTRSSADWTLVAARGTGGGGGPTSLTDLTAVPQNGELLIGNGSAFVNNTLTAGTGVTITNGAGTITIDASGAQELLTATVKNADSVAITKGQVVYLFGATGGFPSVKLANNTSDATSNKTFGVVSDTSIAPNGTGTVTCVGVVDGLNLGAYNDGDAVYLGATAGTFTATKPYAPNHLVFVGIIERANAGNGELYVRIQNGYELEELHNVQITTPPLAGSLLMYDATNSLWKANRLTGGTNIAVTNADTSVTLGLTGTVAVANGGTGVTTSTGTGSVVLSNTPTLVTPNIGAATGTSVNLSGAGTFGGNLTVSGTASVTGQINGSAGYQFRGASATTYELLRYAGGTNNPGIFVSVNESTKKTTIIASGSVVGGQTLVLGAEGAETLTLGAANATLAGNLTVSGTGTSAINNLSITPTSGHVYLTGPSAAGKFITLQNGNATGGINFRDSAGNEVGSYYQVTDVWTFSKNTTISGNLTVSGTGNSSVAGNLGIGTTSPQYSLQVSAPSTASYYPIALSSGVIGTIGNTVGMRFGFTGNTYQKGAIIYESINANGVGKLHFALNATENSSNATLTDSKAVLTSTGNVLIGTTTDSSNGKLQLATHTTSAGGIGFGTDTSLFRSAAGNLQLSASVASAAIAINNVGSGVAALAYDATGALVYSTGSLRLQTNAGTTALTLDSSQNATFAGAKITLGGSGNGEVEIRRAANSNGSSVAYRTSSTLKWYHGLRGLVNDNWYLQNEVAGNTALFFDAATSNATFAGAIAIGNTVNTVSPTSPNRTITMVIGGTTYYIHAKTTND
jgi:hypothetical protein